MAVSAEFQGILDALEEPRLLVRTDYTVAYANRAFRRRFGVEAFEGRRCHELVFHSLRPCSACGRGCPLERAAFSRRVERTVEREFVPGGERFLEIESVPVATADGNPVYFMERILVRDDAESASMREGVVMKSPAARQVVHAIARVAAEEVPVLFCGPGGSGKSSFARLLHDNSRRAVNALVKLDCAALTDKRFEDELLGRASHLGGERTGGLSAQPGGTLYFDEIAALSPGLQKRLLTLLESGLVREAGSAQSVAVDWRIVCATSAPDPDQLVEKGLLRRDLWLRLSVARIDVPALRDRREDLPELARIILKMIGGGSPAELTPAAEAALAGREWPGNIRELECALARAQIFARGRKILPEDIAESPAARSRDRAPAPVPADSGEALLAREKEWRGSRRELARAMGLSERTLYRRLREAKAGQTDRD
ncbi:sigma 54-interacting transcriptional regulator [Sutterella sp.]|uniref:sigma 54-interacting transcriptional regulator n=1 Tax=Sutterella sp. TaxID=1981025 RepID=UPI0026E00E24|nr:sigma 54-interacting transcriptional regulator [Sutterella sp.]MDO5530480.1 sigma 54-interacting transcriptional regulator [Sutterella sp.]